MDKINIADVDPEALYASDTEKTFQYQDDLPSLPVPSLQHTMDRYIDSVKPHLTEEEFDHTRMIATRFADGIGKELNDRLLERASTHRNWAPPIRQSSDSKDWKCLNWTIKGMLEQWWTDYAYMDFRLPNSLINFSGPGPYWNHCWPAQEGTQIERAAIIMYFTANYWHMIRQERLRPEKGSAGERLCMNQYHRAYSMCRIPAQKRDHLKHYFKTEAEGAAPTNIVVMCRGRIFTMTNVDDNEEPLRPPELQKQFQYIRDLCDSQPPGPGVGALTGANRDNWAQMRNRLIALHPKNYENLEEIQQSVMGVILDDDCPTDESDLFQNILAGDSTNRWFDKSLTLIFYKNGLIGSNCDHSPIDAMVLVSSTFYCDLYVMKTQGKWQGNKEVRELAPPRELEFVLDTTILRGIDSAKQMYNAYALNLQCSATHFTGYGKSLLRRYKIHPDSHVQLSLHYAYYKMYKKPASAYETGTTRKFYNARTETVRSCTTEVVDWTKAMLDPNTSLATKYKTYRQALDKQTRLMSEAKECQGCDRHLFGLQILAMESGIPMPELYTDPAWTKSGGGGNFVLSTSFVGYTTVYGGVSPMVEHGYGSFYKIEPQKISTFVTAWKTCDETDAVKFSREIHSCLADMGKLLEQSSGETTARL